MFVAVIDGLNPLDIRQGDRMKTLEDQYVNIMEVNYSQRVVKLERKERDFDGSSRDIPLQGFLQKIDPVTEIQYSLLQSILYGLKKSNGLTTGYPVFDRLFGLVLLKDTDLKTKGLTRDDFFNKNIPYQRISELESIGDQSQEFAVNLSVNSTEILYIEGPAGTGKTTVIAEIVRQAINRGKKVLIVSQMHQAVDNVLAQLMDDPNIPAVRLGNDPSKFQYGTEKVWVGSREKGLNKDVMESFNNKRQLLKKQGKDAYLYASTNIGIATDWIFKQIIGNGTKKILDLVIMDESSRETLTGGLVPLQFLKDDGKVIFVGDHRQLPPFGLSGEEIKILEEYGTPGDKISVYDISIFEWLLERNYGDRILLSTNYRSHPLIAGLVSHLFYDGDINRRGWEDFDSETLSLRVIDILGENETEYFEEKIGTSYRNLKSAEYILKLIKYYHEKKGISLSEITVITPYLLQIGLLQTIIKNEFQNTNNGDMPVVTTIDSYQGGENKAIIFDFVRSNRQGRIGFVKDLRRLNVALSRAQDNLAIVWDSRTFTNVPLIIDTEEDRQARALFMELNEYYEYEVKTFFPEIEETEEEIDVGGIIPIVKEWVLNKFPNLSPETYDVKIAPLWENIRSLIFSGLFVGLPTYLVTGNINLTMRMSYSAAWPLFFIEHFRRNSHGNRAPPVNIFLAGLISIVNLSLPYLLPHMFVIAPIFVIPTSIVGSFLFHYSINILGSYISSYQKFKESNKKLTNFLKIRKELEHPLSNLTYAVTHKTLFKKSTQQEKKVVWVHLDGTVVEKNQEIEVKRKLRIALEGVLSRIKEEQNPKIQFGFILQSKRSQEIIQTLIQEYRISEKLILFSVKTLDEAKQMSKGCKIEFVITALPELCRMYAKNILDIGTKLTVSGPLAKELKNLIDELGFEKSGGADWNWMSGELTIQEKNLKPDDLENLRISETFQIQA